MIDLYLVYQFIRRLGTPFSEWEAFDQGVIDERGNILISKRDRRLSAQMKSFGTFDLLVLKLKKMLEKVPGGKSKVASYGAALWLIKEYNHFSDESMITEEIVENLVMSHCEDTSSLFMNTYSDYITENASVNTGNDDLQNFFMEEIANVAGGGKIAGIGVGPDGEPPLSISQVKKYKSKNKSKKRLRDILGEEEETAPKNVCWKNYKMVGFKNKNGKKVPNCVPDTLGEAEEEAPKDVCWKNYKMVGFKNKNGKKVPNCVPKGE